MFRRAISLLANELTDLWIGRARQNAQEIEATGALYTQEVPQREIRHHRMTKQSKLRHCQIMREKV